MNNKYIQSRTAGPKSTTTTLGGSNIGSASTIIMKRRSNNTYKVATSRRDSLGFSLNGTSTRNIPVGKDSLMSRSPSCCASANYKKVQLSVKNTKGMLANRFRWKKTPVPGQPTLQTIYNRWVSTEQTGNMVTGTTEEYITNMARNRSAGGKCGVNNKPTQGNCGGIADKNNCLANKSFVKNKTCVGSCGSRIEQKRNYPEEHAKFHTFIKDASDANINAIRRRAGRVIEPTGLNKPYFLSTHQQTTVMD
jgi:hypothetical protein